MAGNIQGITIELRGKTTQLEQALRKVNKEIKDTDKELRDVEKALKLNPKNVDLWRAKQDLLKNKISETEDKLKALKDGLAKMDANGVDHSTEQYKSLERQISVTEAELKNFNKELTKTGNAKLTALSEQFKSIGSKMKSAGQTMTTRVTAPIVAGYTLASKYASDYEENLNKLDVAFGSNSQAVKDWANTARTEFGLSKVQATDAASAFGALGKGIGLSESEAANMSTTLAGLSADLGSYFNVGVDESAKALEGIFTGESEALKKFGVVMTDTNLQKFAEDQGLVWKEMDQTQKTMLRYQYVLAKTKDAQGDFARTSDGTANSTKIFQASLQDLGTAIGTNLLPIITPIIQKVTELINKFNELSPTTQKVITIIGLVAAVVGPLLIVLGTLVSSIGAIIGAAPAIVAAMGTFITTAAPVIAIIGALIAIGVLLYKNWDTIKAKAIQLKNNLIATWNNIKSKVTSAVTSLKSKITSTFSAIKSSVANTWNAIKKAIVTPIEKAKTAVSNAIAKIKSVINGAKLKLPHIKLPHFSISGKFSLNPPSIPHISVSWYKQGGIFDSPTIAGIGEAGPEAVVPLDKLWDKLDKIAESSTSDNVTINVYASPGMDVNELARVIEKKLVAFQKQRQMAWQ